MEVNKGIYILSNYSMPEYIKVGYSEDIEQEVCELNKSSAIATNFVVCVIYETPNTFSEEDIKTLKEAFESPLEMVIPPEDYNEDEATKKENGFYKYTPAQGFAALRYMAKCTGTEDKLHLLKSVRDEIEEVCF